MLRYQTRFSLIGGLQNRKLALDQEPWRGMLVTMGRTPEFQNIQCEAASDYYKQAQAMFRDFGLTTERGMALMFDIAVQNGGISGAVRSQIRIRIQTSSGRGWRSREAENYRASPRIGLAKQIVPRGCSRSQADDRGGSRESAWSRLRS